MGQYHVVYNKTKKEFIHPHHMGDGLKLLEFSCGGLTMTGLALLLSNSNGRGGGDLYVNRDYDENYKPKPLKGQAKKNQDAIDKIAGRWAGDEIVVQGDYAEEGDESFISDNELRKYKDISTEVIKALAVDPYIRERIESDNGYLNKKFVQPVLRPDMIVTVKK